MEDEGKRNAWEYYVNEVHEMDKFVGQLIDTEQRGTDVCISTGDHLPDNLTDRGQKDLVWKCLYNTNYKVSGDNIGLKKKDVEYHKLPY